MIVAGVCIITTSAVMEGISLIIQCHCTHRWAFLVPYNATAAQWQCSAKVSCVFMLLTFPSCSHHASNRLPRNRKRVLETHRHLQCSLSGSREIQRNSNTKPQLQGTKPSLTFTMCVRGCGNSLHGFKFWEIEARKISSLSL